MAATPTKNLGFQNFFQATLNGDITASSTDILLDAIPNASEGFLVIEPDSSSAREVIYYNSKTALKVVCPSVADGRGQDDTTAGAHSQGATVIMAPVAGFFEALQSGTALADASIGTRHVTNPYKFAAYTTATTAVAGTSTWTDVAYAGEEFDSNSNFASNTYTAPVNGFYFISAAVNFTAGGTGERYGCRITKNGTSIKENIIHSSVAGSMSPQVTVFIQLAAGDTLKVQAINTSGGAKNVAAGQTACWFVGHLVSET